MNNITKYQSIVAWARKRYMVDRLLIINIGGIPSVYSRIENAAFIKYVRFEVQTTK